MLMLSTSSYTLFNIERNFVIFTHREEANFNRAHQGSSYIHNGGPAVLIHHGIVRRWHCGSLVTQRPLSLLLSMTYQLLLSIT